MHDIFVYRVDSLVPGGRSVLAGVKVTVHGTMQVVTTDSAGKATLTLSAGFHRLNFEKKDFFKFGVEVEVDVTLGIRPSKFTMFK